MGSRDKYVLENQVGHLLRRANQRHTNLFAKLLDGYDLTPLQFAAIMKLSERQELSQNELGRLTAMDPNTVQGVVLRLLKMNLVERRESDTDKRRKLLSLTAEAQRMIDDLAQKGIDITDATLAPLTAAEVETFVGLLRRLT